MTNIRSATVRIWSKDGRIVGAGFLVSDHHVLTAAHVARNAVGTRSKTDPSIHGEELRVDFPMLGRPSPPLQAHVDFVAGDAGEGADVAGLVLDEKVPAGAVAARLVSADSMWGHRFRAPGFPANKDRGEWAYGMLADLVAGDWIQISTEKTSGPRVRPGYSGAPVWDEQLHGATGMIVAAEEESGDRLAYVIPTTVLVRVWSDVLAARAIPPCPYRALYPFEERDSERFFGRDDIAKEVVAEVERRTVVAVIGPSGCGKSSLLHAAVLPALRAEANWLVVEMRPGKDPMSSLAIGIADAMRVYEEGAAWTMSPSEIREAVETQTLPTVATDLLKQSGCSRMLLIVDQLEELFTLCLDEGLRERFAAELAVAGARRGSPHPEVKIMLALRSDFVDRASEIRPLAHVLHGGVIRPSAMTREELRRAIEEPALIAGVRFQPGLTARIVREYSGQRGALPALQFMLTLLWEEQRDGTLTTKAYKAIGGVQGALTRHADAVIADLDPTDQHRAKRVLLQLTGLAYGSIDTRRPLRECDVRKGDWKVISRLADDRLVVLDRDASGHDTAELAHEALAHDWRTLRSWLEEADARLSQADAQADVIIKRFSIGGGAVNVLPPPFDALAVAATFARMGQRLAEVYGLRVGREMLKTTGATMAEGVAATAGGAYIGTSMLKYIPGVNIWAALLIQPPLVGAIGYAVGTTWKYVFHELSAGGKGLEQAELSELVAVMLRNRMRKLAPSTAKDVAVEDGGDSHHTLRKRLPHLKGREAQARVAEARSELVDRLHRGRARTASPLQRHRHATKGGR